MRKSILLAGLLVLFSCNQKIEKQEFFDIAEKYTSEQEYEQSLKILNKLIKVYGILSTLTLR